MRIVYGRVFCKLLKTNNLINCFYEKVCKQKNFLEKSKNKFFFSEKRCTFAKNFWLSFYNSWRRHLPN